MSDPSLWPPIISGAAGLGGAVLGFLGSLAAETKRSKSAAAREWAQRTHEAKLRREEEVHRIQLEALQTVQAAMQRVTRCTMKELHFDLMNSREERFTQLPPGLDDEDLAARVDLHQHASRLLDADVRAAADELGRVTAELATLFVKRLRDLEPSQREDAFQSRTATLMEVATRTQDVVGAAIRTELSRHPEDAR